MSQYIDDYCNDIAREQYNFINDKPIKNNKMKETPIYFTKYGSFKITEPLNLNQLIEDAQNINTHFMQNDENKFDEFFNDFDNINNNFLTIKQESKMKVELIEEELYNETIYWLRIDGSYVSKKKTYEEAKEEFDKAINFQPKTTILESKEI